MKTTHTPRSQSSGASSPSVEPAIVESVGRDAALGRVHVRRASDGALREVVEVRLARIEGYTPRVGDRVMVVFGEGAGYVIAVLHTAPTDDAPAGARSLVLADGARVDTEGARVELRDPAGRLLVRYENGHAEIAAPAGDLTLSAPAGRVVVTSALDIELASGRDVKIQTARRFEVESAPSSHGAPAASFVIDPKRASLCAPEIAVTSNRARLVVGRAEVLARSVALTAEHVAQKVIKLEVSAERLIERTRDTFRETTGLAQICAGTMRSLVQDVFSVHSRRSVLKSSDDTAIDGKKVLLG